MEPERWRKISGIYDALQRQPVAERAAFVREMCGDDASLLHDVESLLKQDGAAAAFLEQPAVRVATALHIGDTHSAVAIGGRVGDYQLSALIGTGGMGEVYLARDLKLERQVALKFLSSDLTRDPGRVARFGQEARAASALNHPNVCTIHAIGETSDGRQFIAMEHIAGETLRARLGRGRLTVDEAVEIATQVGSALSAAHAAGIVHRDLKPENVIVRPDGLVKVLDFGVAKLAPAAASSADTTRGALSTETGVVVGTVPYMSPEQVRGLEVDARTDVWSLGAMVYEMVTGRCPFEGETSSDVLAAILDREPTPIMQFAPDAAGELQRIARKALKKDRNERYQVMQDLLLDLGALRDEPGSGTGKAGTLRGRRLWPIAGIAAVAMFASGSWYLWSLQSPNSPASIIPITSFPGDEDWPDISPDGTQVAFNWSGEKRDNRDVYVIRIGDGTALRLTTDPGFDGTPAWSPNGSQIAFVRQRSGHPSIYTISPLGRDERKLLDGSQLGPDSGIGRMSWLSDGQGLVFVSWSASMSRLVYLNISSGETREVLSSPMSKGVHRMPALSPKGDKLAFVFCDGPTDATPCDPYVVGINPEMKPMGDARRISVNCPRVPTGIAWMPDGRTLVYGCSSSIQFDGRLWRISVSSGKSELLDVPPAALNPTIARLTGRLVYKRYIEDQDLWILHPGSQPEKFASSTYFDVSAEFSPDGRKIAFSSDRSGEPKIWVINSDGTGLGALTRPTGRLQGSPRWSRDGRRIAFDASGPDAQMGIYVVDADGGQKGRCRRCQGTFRVGRTTASGCTSPRRTTAEPRSGRLRPTVGKACR
jgi:serine/threonine protein kinase